MLGVTGCARAHTGQRRQRVVAVCVFCRSPSLFCLIKLMGKRPTFRSDTAAGAFSGQHRCVLQIQSAWSERGTASAHLCPA
ncbi:hypothetical protein BOTBODRAFT_258309 [Botryobasidium botryosum FD-172 SS1]|uniref:Uncharacterized protein n=1 Tax=Botryobasidium botryosum (strain FD-172 SS1) TaxID=930990 RepID=A0A067MNF7_BOTB1|nr:hypothetical protein BOTBODRAFT_258309 [Botryobasidium botryosum FD-172 SS1]